MNFCLHVKWALKKVIQNKKNVIFIEKIILFDIALRHNYLFYISKLEIIISLQLTINLPILET